MLTSRAMLLRNDRFKTVIGLGSHTHGIFERARPDRCDHELLKCHCVPRMSSSVQNVQKRHGKHVWCLDPSFFTKKLVERQPLG